MTPEAAFLTPDQARARFGELLHPATRTHVHFADPAGGEWRPELAGGELRGYRLHPALKVPHVRPPFRPKG